MWEAEVATARTPSCQTLPVTVACRLVRAALGYDTVNVVSQDSRESQHAPVHRGKRGRRKTSVQLFGMFGVAGVRAEYGSSYHRIQLCSPH